MKVNGNKARSQKSGGIQTNYLKKVGQELRLVKLIRLETA